ncbi:hypothetical protein BKA65DRAFT_293334 [Rhexocercosporidium sp. MPI-PUGE-AT-0058]|nr:hypothetical protein BKA65DRAFT_293334 [Rhexocercosporidium sp. MPI-PUGE-AT-0058]
MTLLRMRVARRLFCFSVGVWNVVDWAEKHKENLEDGGTRETVTRPLTAPGMWTSFWLEADFGGNKVRCWERKFDREAFCARKNTRS